MPEKEQALALPSLHCQGIMIFQKAMNYVPPSTSDRWGPSKKEGGKAWPQGYYKVLRKHVVKSGVVEVVGYKPAPSLYHSMRVKVGKYSERNT
jgi:hypothetical protein